MVGVVGDRREIFKDFVNAFFNERIIAVFLNLNEIGDIDYLVDLPELPSFGFAVL